MRSTNRCCQTPSPALVNFVKKKFRIKMNYYLVFFVLLIIASVPNKIIARTFWVAG